MGFGAQSRRKARPTRFAPFVSSVAISGLAVSGLIAINALPAGAVPLHAGIGERADGRAAALHPVAFSDSQGTVPHQTSRAPAFDAEVERRDYTLKRGDTLMTVLLSAGATRGDADRAIRALGKRIKLNRLQIGQAVRVYVDRSKRHRPGHPAAQLAGVMLDRRGDRAVLAFRDVNGRFKTETLAATAAEAVIDSIVTIEDPDSGDRMTTREVTLRRGDTLTAILVRAGADRADAARAVRALAKRINLKRMQIGQKITVAFARDSGPGDARLSSVAVHRKQGDPVAVWRDGSGRFTTRPAPGAGRSDSAGGPDHAEDADQTGIEERRLRLGKGDILLNRMVALGAARGDADRAARALGGLVNLRRLQIGQEFVLSFSSRNDQLIGLRLVRGGKGKTPATEISVRRTAGGGFAKGRVAMTGAAPASEAGAQTRAHRDGARAEAGTAQSSETPSASKTGSPSAESESDPTGSANRNAGEPAGTKTDKNEAGATGTGKAKAKAAKVIRGGKTGAAESPLTGDSAVVMTVGRGDTFFGLLSDAGLSRTEAVRAAKTISKLYNPSRLKVGQKIVVAVEFEGSDVRLSGLVLETGRNRSVLLLRAGADGFVARSGRKDELKTAIAAAETIGDHDVPPARSAYELALDAEGIDPAALAADAEAERRKVVLDRGDTLMRAMLDAGCSSDDANAVIRSAKAHMDVRKLKPGMDFDLVFSDDPGTEAKALALMRVDLDAEARLEIVRLKDGSYVSGVIAKPLQRQLVRADGRIDNNLYTAAREAALPHDALLRLIKIFSYDIDFQRDIQKGDAFEVLFEQFVDEDGAVVRSGPILFAAMTVSGTRLTLYRFALDGDYVDYFDETGQSVRKALMRTPIDGARLTSRFGMRRHPIQGYTRMHRGVDFAASRGTPIYAAGDGVVEKAHYWSSYGNYVRLRHSSEYKTAYAHLRKFAKGVYPGKRVRQGQIIGYVGSTGRSTGPHLHYEVLRNGKQVNPLSVKLPAGEKLRGDELRAFHKERDRLSQIYAGLPSPTTVAAGVRTSGPASGPTSVRTSGRTGLSAGQ